MDTQELMEAIVQQLQQVTGIAGVVLGGSCARGTHTEQSDIDLHAFLSSVYMAEIALCQILWDPQAVLKKLKSQTAPYPSALKQTLIKQFFWEAEFSVRIASKGILRNDVSYVVGCCFRGISCLMQTLFALNERYWMNEKGAVALAQTFSLCPARLEERVQYLFANLSPEHTSLTAAVQLLETLVKETGILLKQ